MNIKTKVCVQKWQLEQNYVSNYYCYYPKVQHLLLKLHVSVFSEPAQAKITLFFKKNCEHNMQTRESPNLRKYPIHNLKGIWVFGLSTTFLYKVYKKILQKKVYNISSLNFTF